MSRIGQKPIDIPSGVTVAVEGQRLCVKGPKGDLSREVPVTIQAAVQGGKLVVSRRNESKSAQALHGLIRTLALNMVVGVTKGYSKDLEIQGVGYRAAVQGPKLVLSVGLSGPIEYPVPEGVKVTVEGGTGITVSGADKERVGIVADRIRGFAPPEPYKGKGIRYKGEYVRHKVGKTVA
jgi:large subunit ribosomal protein L6